MSLISGVLLASCWDHIWPIAHTYDGPDSKSFCLDIALKPFVSLIP